MKSGRLRGSANFAVRLRAPEKSSGAEPMRRLQTLAFFREKSLFD
jgi:hypothetical protein